MREFFWFIFFGSLEDLKNESHFLKKGAFNFISLTAKCTKTSTSNGGIWPKTIQIACSKVPFWQFFRMGCDGRALLVWPSRIPYSNLKNIFVLGPYDSLERLEGKIGQAPFF